MRETRIFAHRGVHMSCIENTMEAYEIAIEQNVDGIELDVQMTRDGAVVVLHDERVERVWDGSGAVKDYTYAQIKKLRARNNMYQKDATIPSLEEVLRLCSPSSVLLNIELKTRIEPYPGIEEKTISLVDQYGMRERVLYSSFNHHSLMAIKQLDPAARIGLLYSSVLVQPWAYANRIGADAVHPNISSMRMANLVRDCHQHGLDINVWTVDDPAHMRFCMEQGVDSIITNRTDLAAFQKKAAYIQMPNNTISKGV